MTWNYSVLHAILIKSRARRMGGTLSKLTDPLGSHQYIRSAACSDHPVSPDTINRRQYTLTGTEYRETL